MSHARSTFVSEGDRHLPLKGLATLVDARIDALTWEWPWWDATAPWLIFLLGYLWFFLVAFWVHDMNDIRRQARAVGVLWSIAALGVLIFGLWLGWL